jgi:hypothetical protein
VRVGSRAIVLFCRRGLPASTAQRMKSPNIDYLPAIDHLRGAQEA